MPRAPIIKIGDEESRKMELTMYFTKNEF